MRADIADTIELRDVNARVDAVTNVLEGGGRARATNESVGTVFGRLPSDGSSNINNEPHEDALLYKDSREDFRERVDDAGEAGAKPNSSVPCQGSDGGDASLTANKRNDAIGAVMLRKEGTATNEAVEWNESNEATLR
jgi:hypothetical protein